MGAPKNRIEVHEDTLLVFYTDKNGVELGHFLVDLADVHLLGNRKWGVDHMGVN